jgi:hypothetical protein
VAKAKPKGKYRSTFEYNLSKKMKGCEYEPFQFEYTIDHEYTPDWVSKDGTVWYEAKGYFRDRREARKYLYIAEQAVSHAREQCLIPATLIFIFKDPNKAMPGAQRRKDGTKQSMAEWADLHEIPWCTPDTVQDEWL